MNNVNLIGRLTADPQVKYVADSQTAICEFILAIDRGKTKEGKDLGAYFIRCKAFGKRAETISQYVKKGHLFGISGHMTSGKWEKDGQTHYTQDVVVDAFDFLQGKKEQKGEYNQPDNFEQVNEDIPF